MRRLSIVDRLEQLACAQREAPTPKRWGRTDRHEIRRFSFW